ncbi:MAG TPA: Z1 domain-containing protein, partial [Myxococcota bacterium]|nr:Z1 domain-containing protein [Myxococcota bacterium]
TEDPSTINKLILDILGQFPKGAYLAYTATPFANILSDPLYPNLLYPRDFIVDLPMPEGYFGTERIFGSEPLEQGAPSSDGLPMIRTVPDEEVGQVKPPTRDSRDSFQPQLTNSLVDAMLWFLLSCGVRRARGQAGQHMSMLIHTTLYTDVHVRFESLLRQDLKQIQEKLLKGDVVLLQRIGCLWAEETAKIPPESFGEKRVSLESAIAELPAVLAALRVVIDNAKSESRLSFPEGGSTQIVVGGNTLSRGLTIEGLMVSYFVRASHMYDTLLQMARWFGYRWGYADLPRIWMTTELAEHFQHLAQVEQEVRRDIRAYEEQQLTPKDFAPYIQTHSTL